MEEDEGATAPAARPRATAVVTGSSSQAGPMTVAQKTSMGLVLRGMFLDKERGTHSVTLGQLVEKYNQKASVPASTVQIDEVYHLCIKLTTQAGTAPTRAILACCCISSVQT